MSDERSSIIISVFSTTPGIGKTVTAINLAAGLAKEGYGVCLVDLDLQFGDVLNYLKLSSDYTIAKAQRSILTNPDNFNVKDFLINYNYGYLNFSIMAPPIYVYDAYQIDVHTIENIIKQLTYFDFVVLDLSSVFSSLNLAMLDISTVINFLGVIDFLPALKNSSQKALCLTALLFGDLLFNNFKNLLYYKEGNYRIDSSEQAACKDIGGPVNKKIQSAYRNPGCKYLMIIEEQT